jgi:erythromycin esterase
MRANEFPNYAELLPDPSDALHAFSKPLDTCEDVKPLIERIGAARLVLLGEASHGTAEYYEWRRRISQRLICDQGFNFIAVEGDWPDCYRVNRYVKHRPEAGDDAREVLHAFGRWPTWMWANEEVVDLAEWLRGHNDAVGEDRKVGFYGLDVYSLWESMDAVQNYLAKTDGSALAAARRAFLCFEPFDFDVQEYAHAAAWVPESCEEEVVRLLAELRRQAPRYDHDGREAYFDAEQNALVAKNAEAYYRTMIRGNNSWNVRDKHMVETLNRLLHLHGPASKGIVWEHNTHIGDARYTDMAAAGMVNVGELVRKQHPPEDVVLVGFSGHRGSVIAGDDWGSPMRTMPVTAARSGSWEDVLHQAIGADSLLIFSEDCPGELLEPRGQRAIGVVYRPELEAYGNYVPTILPRRYNALAHFEETHALHPLHVAASIEHEVPETYPTGA